MNKTFYLKNDSTFFKRRVVITEEKLPPFNRRKSTDWWINGNRPDVCIIADICAYLYLEAWNTYPSREKGYGESRGYFVSQLFGQAIKKLGRKVQIKVENKTWTLTNCSPNIDLRFIYGDLDYCDDMRKKYDLRRKWNEEEEKERCWHGLNWYNPRDELCRRKNRLHLAVRTEAREAGGEPKSTEEIVETFVHELAHIADRTKERHSNMGAQPISMFYRWLILQTLKNLNFNLI